MHRKYFFYTICIFDNLGVLVKEKQLKNEPRCIHEGYAASNTFTPAGKEQAYIDVHALELYSRKAATAMPLLPSTFPECRNRNTLQMD